MIWVLESKLKSGSNGDGEDEEGGNYVRNIELFKQKREIITVSQIPGTQVLALFHPMVRLLVFSMQNVLSVKFKLYVIERLECLIF